MLPTSSLGLRRGVLLTPPWGLWKGQDRFRKTQMAGEHVTRRDFKKGHGRGGLF